MSRDKYLIAIDLDGTLLTDKKTISPKTRDYLNYLGNNGHHIVIATGRPLRAAYSYQKELGVSAPIVSYNGALASAPEDASFPKLKVIFDVLVLQEIVEEIGYKILDNLMIEGENTVFLLHKDDELNTFFWNDRGTIVYGNPFVHDIEEPMTLIFLFNDLSEETKDRVTKIVRKHPGYNIRFWNYGGYAELYLDNSTKKEAVEHVMHNLGVHPHNVIVCGDAENDRDMLIWGHHSILMKNGVEALRPYATIVTEEDNNNDGLVNAIKSIIN